MHEDVYSVSYWDVTSVLVMPYYFKEHAYGKVPSMHVISVTVEQNVRREK
jgi:hypothetical protein